MPHSPNTEALLASIDAELLSNMGNGRDEFEALFAAAEADVQEATVGYLSVYAGPWGLKASEEDAVFGMIRAVWPEFDAAGDGFDRMRADDRYGKIADAMFEDCGETPLPLLVAEHLPALRALVEGTLTDDDPDHGERPDPPVAYHVIGTDSRGNSSAYPVDDYLRDMGAEGCPLITDEAEALQTAKSALVEGEGWREARIYRRTNDGMHVLAGQVWAVPRPLTVTLDPWQLEVIRDGLALRRAHYEGMLRQGVVGSRLPDQTPVNFSEALAETLSVLESLA